LRAVEDTAEAAFRLSPEFFPMLGNTPGIGRGFTEEDARPGR
jgi:hypothetical protein